MAKKWSRKLAQVLALISMITGATAQAGEPQGRYFIEDVTGRVGTLAIEPLGQGRLTFSLHTAVPGLCGQGFDGEAVWANGRAVFTDQGGERITFIDQNGAIVIESSGPGLASSEPCSPAGRYTNQDTPAPGTPEEIVREIRVHYAAINTQLNRLDTVETDLEGESTEGSQLQAWLDGDDIRKLEVIHYGEMGRLRQEFYYWLGRLFFVFQAEDRYREPLGEVAGTLENRFYFSQGRLIRWLGPEKTEQPLTGEAAVEMEKSLNGRSDLYQAAVRTAR
jgi:hypothetical protein